MAYTEINQHSALKSLKAGEEELVGLGWEISSPQSGQQHWDILPGRPALSLRAFFCFNKSVAHFHSMNFIMVIKATQRVEVLFRETA